MKNDANLYAFGRLADEIRNQFRTAAYVLAVYGKINRGATTRATTHYSDERNLRCIRRSTPGTVCDKPFQKDSFVSRERPVIGNTVVIGFYHQAMVVGFFVNCCKIAISLIEALETVRTGLSFSQLRGTHANVSQSPHSRPAAIAAMRTPKRTSKFFLTNSPAAR
jgi:hypothetical protein